MNKNSKLKGVSRRAALAMLAAAPLAKPGLVRAQAASGPIKMGILSDMNGPLSGNGGLGTRVAAELAIADFGGSVLGRPIEVTQADNQNKPEVASSLAREWLDNQGVTVLLDGAVSSAALAIQQVSKERKRIYLINASIANSLVGEQCSPYSFQFGGNAYALSKGVSDTLTRQGQNTWFIITFDYETGYALQRGMEEFVQGAGGKTLGAVRAPLGTTDFASYLVQAKASGAKVIGLGLGGTDLQNCIKQGAEFGIAKGGQHFATPIVSEYDVVAIGQDACAGLMCPASFYWNMSPETRAFSERFMAKMKRPPLQWHASSYVTVTHWLKAVQAAGTVDADAVAAKMREMPVNDMYNKDVRI